MPGLLEKRAIEADRVDAEKLREAVEESRRALVAEETRQARKVYKLLTRAQRKLKRVIAAAYAENPKAWNNGTLVKTRRYEALLAETETLLDTLINQWRKTAKAAAEKAYLHDYYGSQVMLSEVAGLEISFTSLTPEHVKAATNLDIINVGDSTMSKRFKSLSSYTHRRIKDEIAESVVLGRSIDETIRKVVKATKVPAASAARTVRTGMMKAANNASLEIHTKNGIEYVERCETLDSRTCVVCGSHDGDVHKIGEEPNLPAHFNCRGCWIPRPRFGGKGRPRARRRGRWGEWISEQTPEVQREVMSNHRWALWKSGVIEIEDMYDGVRILPPKEIAKVKKAVGKALKRGRELKWRRKRGLQTHVRRRIHKYQQLPPTTTDKDYEDYIAHLLNNKENPVFVEIRESKIYYWVREKRPTTKGYWTVVIDEEGNLVTCHPKKKSGKAFKKMDDKAGNFVAKIGNVGGYDGKAN